MGEGRGRRGGDSHFPLAGSACALCLARLCSRLLSLFHDVTRSFFPLPLPSPSPSPSSPPLNRFSTQPRPGPVDITPSSRSLPFHLLTFSTEIPVAHIHHRPVLVISLEHVRPNRQSVSSPATAYRDTCIGLHPIPCSIGNGLDPLSPRSLFPSSFLRTSAVPPMLH